jgi:hypothetical protein
MHNIFTIEEDGKIKEWEVTPNPLMAGWSLCTEVDKTKEYVDVFPLMPGTLERNRFDSIKKSETYAGLGNLVYYNSREEAQEVIDLEKQFKKELKDD